MTLNAIAPSSIGSTIEVLRLRALLEREAILGENEIRDCADHATLRAAAQQRVVRLRRLLAGGEEEVQVPACSPWALRQAAEAMRPIPGRSHDTWHDETPEDWFYRAEAIRHQFMHREARPYWIVLGREQRIAPGRYVLQLHVPRCQDESLVRNIVAVADRQSARNCLPPDLIGFCYDDTGAISSPVEIWAMDAGTHAKSPAMPPF